MKRLKDNIFPLMLMLLIPLVNIFYGYINNPRRGTHSLVTDLDRSIPFIKAFIIPYLIWYPFIILTLIYLCIYYRETYYKAISTIIIGMLLSYLVYFLFQTTVPRPILTENDSLTEVVKFVYKTDNPFNCFPSIHVLTSYAMIRGVRKSSCSKLTIKLTIYLTAILIILSTEFVKQHVILDIFSAILLTDGIYRTIDNLTTKRCLVWKKKQFWSWMTKKKLEI